MDSSKCAGQLLDLFVNVHEKNRESIFLREATPEELMWFKSRGIVPIKVPPLKKPFLQELLGKVHPV
jgi:hypothetical protein